MPDPSHIEDIEYELKREIEKGASNGNKDRQNAGSMNSF
jgi:hypothetical protein